ncbi:roadblock/LC7 domain-containing protein [Wenjunlia tyrosinilytica]|jgi:predicted regulator of Ras-like GTPase activity (Roadblock/LC7/MglB family)|uniref:Dynein regulation protein LC7 n=1 Tax=Wenjunlia tyrosinilytica TaxID=1544741 RepID=A0A917ZZA0_9ACTN|nr:roadblock/LC7 domain-containing protein [Wenjunlia tyrosinilytica]GGP01367.1 dynein regulation protein LC7 [Wenjunlia tyrosinilytica]
MNRDALLVELHALPERVAGITDTAVATVDGLLVAATGEHVQPETLAALAAAMLGLAQRAAHEVGKGEGAFRETVTRCDSGYIAVYSVGDEALLVVLADRDLNLARLHLEARGAIDRISHILFGEPQPTR